MKHLKQMSGSSGQCSRPARWLSGLALIGCMVFWLAAPAQAVLPPAGAVIGNQASATYTDLSGQTKTATSNLVETLVQQVGVFTLVQDNTKTAAIGNTVYMPHTLTNLGNGSDSFVLTTSDFGGDTFTATNIALYLDANGDGLPDSTTPLVSGLAGSFTTPIIPAGGTYNFVMSMTVPAGATSGQIDKNYVTATASTLAVYDGDGDGTFGEVGDNVKTNTDTLTVTATAAFQVNKSISVSQGPASGTLTYTLTYKNIGGAPGILALFDVIGYDGTGPTGNLATDGFSYVADSAVWSAGATALDDAYVTPTPDATVGGMEAHYKADTAAGVTTIQANITNVGPNVTGTITFQVDVLSTALVGTSSTTNTAYYGIDNDFDPEDNDTGTDSTQPSNPSPYKVLATYNVVLNDGTNVAGVPTDGTNTRPLALDVEPLEDLSHVATTSPGQTISFNNYVWNTGNSPDTFNVTATGLTTLALNSNSWPAGTTFQAYKSDGFTPLLDSNGDGLADTGSLAAGASYVVVLKATLPANACDGGCPTGPFVVEKIATSAGDPTKTNKTYDRLGSLTAPTVDLANSTGAVDTGVNQDDVGALTTTKSLLPGGSTVFNLYVRNEGLVADTYSLAYSGTNAFSPTTTLPSGWTLELRAATSGDCSTTGSLITSVGPVAASAEAHLCAVVTVPSYALAATTNVYFQAKSQATGAADAKWDAVTVTAVNSLTLQPNQSGQVYPGGTVVYPHTLSNTGNTTCGNNFNFTVAESLTAQGWTYVLYSDVNGDGMIDALDTVIDQAATPDLSTSLAPGAQYKILVKVFAPAGAAAASTDVLSIFANATCGVASTNSSTATDTTTVVTGQVRLDKTQTIDVDCDGAATADPAFSAAQLTARPGQCIRYEVLATNEGLGNVTNMTIADSMPSYTGRFPVVVTNPSCTTGAGTVNGTFAAPTFSCTGITLAPAASATMTFSVKVDQ